MGEPKRITLPSGCRHRNFVLAPFGGLRLMNVRTCGKPRRCQFISVVDEEVRRTGTAIVDRHHAEVDLDAVPVGETVAVTLVRTDGETEPPVMR